MTFVKYSIGILFFLALSRFIPHPPNFTSLLALSFYVPALLGLSYLPILVLSFIITDLFIGFHSTVFFTWGSVIIVGILSKYFLKSISHRMLGSLGGCLVFFLITNFGVWSLGSYGYTVEGFIKCYILAIPFFGYSLISTFIFSAIIESFIRFKKISRLVILNSKV